MKNIQFLIHYIKRKKMIIRNMYSYQLLLKKGSYGYDSSMKVVYLDDDQVREYVQAHMIKDFLQGYELIVRNMIFRLFFSGKYSIDFKESRYKGSIYLPANIANNDPSKKAKIFNIQEQYVIDIFSEKQDFYKKIENVKRFKNIYNMPKIIGVNTEGLMLVEKLIRVKEADNHVVFQGFITQYFNYMALKESESNHYYTVKLEQFKLFIRTYFKGYPYKMVKKCKPMPCMLQHGDLWRGNLLYDGKQTYVIDYEHADYYPMLYDFYYYMTHECLIYHNDTCLVNYFHGKYDYYLFEHRRNDTSKQEEKRIMLYLQFLYYLHYDIKNPWMTDHYIKLNEIIFGNR